MPAAAQVGPLGPDSQPASVADAQAAPARIGIEAGLPASTPIPEAAAADQPRAVIAHTLPDSERLPLGLAEVPSQLVAPEAGGSADTTSKLPAGTLRTALALGGVLFLIGALAWVFKRVARMSGGLAGAVGAGGRAPAGLVEVLARYPLGARQTLVVLRFDRRVLLCSMSGGGRSGAGAMTTLCELDDAEDVASVLVKTRDATGDSIASTFDRAMHEADRYAERRETTEPIKVRVPAGYAAQQGRLGNQASDDEDGRGSLSRGLGSLLRGRTS